MYGNCGMYCDPEELSGEDRKALLKEKKAILEAKLATVQHLLESLDSEEKSDKE